jgi:hypothetical protein
VSESALTGGLNEDLHDGLSTSIEALSGFKELLDWFGS